MWKSKAIKLVLVGLIILTTLLAGGCFNKAPVITSLTPSATTVASGASCTVNCVASDPDADALTYSWSATGGAISGTGSTVTWIAPTTVGSYTVTVSVSDGKAAAVSESVNIPVVNTPPVIASLTPSTTSLAPNASCTITCAASDADGDTITYTWTAPSGTITGTGNSVSWEAPATEGTYTISVSVSDGHGGTASDSCAITVEMKYGSINIQSNPDGATVYLNGVDTGNITPYVITNVLPGSYTVKLEMYHYKYRQQTITVTANETTYLNWALTYASNATLTIQPDPTAGKDATVYNGEPGTNLGSYYQLIAGSRAMGLYRAYLQFSLDSLPENAVIISARLGLYYFDSAISVQTPIGVYLVQGAWNETTITWANQPTAATTPEFSLTAAPSTYGWLYWTISNMVKGWRDGSIANYGVMLRDDENWWDWKYFISSDYGTATYRPILEITYFDPTS
jgi:hypothetical protein